MSRARPVAPQHGTITGIASHWSADVDWSLCRENDRLLTYACEVTRQCDVILWQLPASDSGRRSLISLSLDAYTLLNDILTSWEHSLLAVFSEMAPILSPGPRSSLLHSHIPD